MIGNFLESIAVIQVGGMNGFIAFRFGYSLILSGGGKEFVEGWSMGKALRAGNLFDEFIIAQVSFERADEYGISEKDAAGQFAPWRIG